MNFEGSNYHFGWGQNQDDITDFAAVLPPVLRSLQAGDADVTPLEMLHVAAEAERRKEAVFKNVSERLASPAMPFISIH